MTDEERATAESEHLEQRIHVLHELGHRLFDRSRKLRDSLICLLVTVLLMIGCSLGLGLAILRTEFEWLALGLFVAGMLVMVAGIVLAIQELIGALVPLMFEHEMMEDELPPHDPGAIRPDCQAGNAKTRKSESSKEGP
jgi:hypothetical protein